MIVVFAERAKTDIADIYESIAARSVASARRVETAIRGECERMTHFPYAAVAIDEPNMFRSPLVHYPYRCSTAFRRAATGSKSSAWDTPRA
jgi:plasmid stabilization system protein ParE